MSCHPESWISNHVPGVIARVPLLAGLFCFGGLLEGQGQEAPVTVPPPVVSSVITPDLVASPVAVMTAVTFATDPGKLYAPLMEIAGFMGWSTVSDLATKELRVNGTPVAKENRRRLLDGTELVSTIGLAGPLAEIIPNPADGAEIIKGPRSLQLRRAAKRVEVSLAGQQLEAWEGNRLVLRTNVSTGRHGGTPSGDYTAGPYKARRHYSRLYHRAPMPWSVQVNGHVFIHGFTSVPSYPASRGCIRMPLTGANPARLFYEWVDPGTPVRILPVPKKQPPVKTKTKSRKSAPSA